MSSSGEDRSLASGIPIPQWMRSKTEIYGFDPSTLSPPTHEGDFFYIKFPRTQQVETSTVKTLTEVLEVKEQAFIKHTDSCKQFIPKIKDTIDIQKPKIIKPMGVDDGFKGESAACGASVVEVAHQMLISKTKGKPFKPLNRGETEGNLAPSPSYVQQRRNSKSLPTTPAASPESSPLTRKKHTVPLQSRLFGGTLFQYESNLSESDEDIDKKSGSSWILSSLFSSKEKKENEKEPTNETSAVAVNLDSKNQIKSKEEISNKVKESINMNVEIKAISSSPAPQNKGTIFKSKPHLRDLNFMTPSSM